MTYLLWMSTFVDIAELILINSEIIEGLKWKKMRLLIARSFYFIVVLNYYYCFMLL